MVINGKESPIISFKLVVNKRLLPWTRFEESYGHICLLQAGVLPLPLRAEVGGRDNDVVLVLHQYGDFPATRRLQ